MTAPVGRGGTTGRAEPFTKPGLDHAAETTGIDPLGCGNPDPDARLDRDHPYDLPFLVAQERHANRADHRGLVPVGTAGRAIGQKKHDIRHARVAKSCPDLAD